jgi:hypothetical protein
MQPLPAWRQRSCSAWLTPHLKTAASPSLPQDAASTDFKLLLKRFKAEQAAAGKKEASLYSGMMKALGRPAAKKPAAPDSPAPGDAPASAGGENEAAAADGGAAAAPAGGEAMEQP